MAKKSTIVASGADGTVCTSGMYDSIHLINPRLLDSC